MSKARIQISGQVAHVIRRTRRGRFLLRPSNYMNSAIAYELAVSAQHTGQAITGATFMSNHYHVQVIDHRANRSLFVQCMNRGITERVKRARKYDGSVWSKGTFKDVQILDEQRELDTLLYIWLNPVKDRLVKRVRHWPGFQILPEHWEKEITIKKPKSHYGRKGPDEVTFVPQRPVCLRDMPLEEAVELANAMIAELEAHYDEERRKKREEVVGRNRIMIQCPTDGPREPVKPSGPHTLFSASTETAEEAAKERYKSFLDRYETQRLKWAEGKKVTFPCGTLKLKREAPIKCSEPKPDHPGLYRETAG